MDLNFSYKSIDHEAAVQFVKQFRDDQHESMMEHENDDIEPNQVIEAVSSIIKSCVPDCHQVGAYTS